MGTRATIAKIQSDGSIKAIIVQMDGGFSPTGITLVNHYKNAEKVDSLIDLGYLQYVGSRVSTTQFHDIDRPAPDVTVAYARDGSYEQTIEIDYYNSLEEYTKNHWFQVYNNYLYYEGKWYVKIKELPWILLSKKVLIDYDFSYSDKDLLHLHTERNVL